jgi:hypothetical protein
MPVPGGHLGIRVKTYLASRALPIAPRFFARRAKVSVQGPGAGAGAHACRGTAHVPCPVTHLCFWCAHARTKSRYPQICALSPPAVGIVPEARCSNGPPGRWAVPPTKQITVVDVWGARPWPHAARASPTHTCFHGGRRWAAQRMLCVQGHGAGAVA